MSFLANLFFSCFDCPSLISSKANKNNFLPFATSAGVPSTKYFLFLEICFQEISSEFIGNLRIKEGENKT